MSPLDARTAGTGCARVAAMDVFIVVFVFAADVANRVPRAIRERPLREIGVIVTDTELRHEGFDPVRPRAGAQAATLPIAAAEA
ncbi:hypothetical protein EMIT0111MI5_70229 [Burkholderia sp. IT-111MI5]